MPIINMNHWYSSDENTVHEGEYCPLDQHRKELGYSYSIYKTSVGLCLHEFERNGYDDSDFFMVVWDEATQEPRIEMFASTRFWSGPCFGSKPDATPEVRAKYEAWKKEDAARQQAAKRAKRAKMLVEYREKMRADAAACGTTYTKLRKMEQAVGETYLGAIVALLKTKKFRSNFRANIAKQVRDWLSQDTPKYRSPLTFKQLQWI